ncbi:MAG: L,D-transpeptidase [Myxococcales bacterium]|nr:L,D-transpeptidase [Polyangiaceae bacterium]MDW8249930.1 L,D-transpeptidase [Myxococcales bacterium]
MPAIRRTPEESKLTEMVVVSGHAQVFLGPVATKGTQIGYLKRGSRVRAEVTPQQGPQCTEGWLRLEEVGFVCARHLSTNLDAPQGKARPPALEDILPYRYGYNVAHGTPLYRTVPSREDMAEYEPYLKIERKKKDKDETSEPHPISGTKAKKKKKRTRETSDSEARAEARDPSSDTLDENKKESNTGPVASSSAPTGLPLSAPTTMATPTTDLPDAGVLDAAVAAATASLELDAGPPTTNLDGGVDAGEDESTKPWWLRHYDGDKKPEIKLSDLQEGSDKILAKRMVKGFYVAIDSTFFSNGRGWHKTTTNLIAPADRLALVKPNEFRGQEIDEAHATHPVAFVLGKQITTYLFEAEGKPPVPKGSLKRYDRVFLTGRHLPHGSRIFRETTDGFWVREGDVTFTEPGTRPPGVGPQERWIDVNLTRQTLVAFEGDRPVFATLVSTGRKGRDKVHDHQTPQGAWRVREKHIAATMDGDGAAAGDLPYSIEDVPYVQYFHESYALHGAFWHDNFGRQQSHGCVNLAPLDAKRLFFWADPRPPRGWFGMFSSADFQGSLIVIHD